MEAAAKLTKAEIVQELEYLLFVEHEEDMANYSHLKPVLSEAADIILKLHERTVEHAVIDARYSMIHRLRDAVI